MNTSDILDGIKTILEAAFPGEAVYTNRVRQGFVRPSFLIQGGQLTLEDMNCGLLDFSQEVTVTAFVTVDEYHDSHFAELVRRMEALLELFRGGCVEIGDRYPDAKKLSGFYELDFAQVKFTLGWQEWRSGGVNGPLAEHYTLKVKNGD